MAMATRSTLTSVRPNDIRALGILFIYNLSVSIRKFHCAKNVG